MMEDRKQIVELKQKVEADGMEIAKLWAVLKDRRQREEEEKQ